MSENNTILAELTQGNQGILEEHSDDLKTIRFHLDRIKKEVQILPEIEEKMEKLLENLLELALDEPEISVRTIIQAVEGLTSVVGTRKGLLAEFLRFKDVWDRKVGVDMIYDVQKTSHVERVKAEVKNEFQPSPENDARDVTREKMSIFTRNP